VAGSGVSRSPGEAGIAPSYRPEAAEVDRATLVGGSSLLGPCS